MSYTVLAIMGFTSGCGFAALVASLMAGYYSVSKALSEV